MARRGMGKHGDARTVNSGRGGVEVVDEMLRPRESKEGETEDPEGHLRGHCVTRGGGGRGLASGEERRNEGRQCSLIA